VTFETTKAAIADEQPLTTNSTTIPEVITINDIELAVTTTTIVTTNGRIVSLGWLPAQGIMYDPVNGSVLTSTITSTTTSTSTATTSTTTPRSTEP